MRQADIFDLRTFLTEGQLEKNLKEFEEEGSAEEKAFDTEFMSVANGIASALGKELKAKQGDNKEPLEEGVITGTIALVLTSNAIVGFISKYTAKLMKKLNWKKGEDIAEKIHHWAHDNEQAFQAPIKRVLGFFIKDPAKLDLTVKAIYAVVVGSMAAGYGSHAIESLSKADWFKGAIGALKTVAKGDEAFANAFPVVKSLI